MVHSEVRSAIKEVGIRVTISLFWGGGGGGGGGGGRGEGWDGEGGRWW